MIRLDRTRRINAPPAAIFAAISDPGQLAGLLPRVHRVEFIEHGTDDAHIAAHMAIGPFSDIRTEGHLCWQTDREILFRAHTPVVVESRWTLTPANGGTDLRVTFELDLTPLLGPFAAFIPPEQVARVIGPDIDSALAEVASRTERVER